MAYNQNNLSNLASNLTTGSWSTWCYRSADPIATVIAAGYITNPLEMGLAVLDLVYIVDTAALTVSMHKVTAATATSATLSAGTTVA